MPHEPPFWNNDPEWRDESDEMEKVYRFTAVNGGVGEFRGLGEWDDDDEPIPPRGWLLGNILCRQFVSSLVADGGVGKTAVRIAQCLSLATGRSLTGEHVFKRCRVLIVSMEDSRDELRRRLRAARIHYGISAEDVRGWLFYVTAEDVAGAKLAVTEDGAHRQGALADMLVDAIKRRSIDFVCLDPFVKAHGVEENSNDAVDFVIGILARIAIEQNCGVDAPHHVNKGPAAAGDANRGRGASSFKDGARLVYTLTPMSEEESQQFGVSNELRRSLIRMDSGKVNIAPPAAEAKWFRIVGVQLGNHTCEYPNGDEVQTIEVWQTAASSWIETRSCESLFVDLLGKIRVEGQTVSHKSRAGNYAPRNFNMRPERGRFKLIDFEKAMHTLLSAGKIKVITYKDEQRRVQECLSVPQSSEEASDDSP